MRQYETVFLISPDLSEEETESIILKMAEVISKKKGKMINKEEWGKKKLAYPIKKFEEAFYVLFYYEGEPDILTELERRFRQTDAIIRYLTLRKETKENIRGRRKAVSGKKEAAASEEKKEEKTNKSQQESPSGETVEKEK